MNREDLLKPKEIRHNNKIRLITDYNKKNPPMNEITQTHSHLLERTRKPAFNRTQLQVTHSRGPNLGDLLTHTELERKQKNRGCRPCNKPCATCKHVKTSQTVRSSQTGKTYSIMGDYTCQTVGAVYVLTCNECHTQYVGETGNTINERFRGHTSCIRHHKDNPVSNHMNTHSNKLNFSIHVVASTRADQNNRRRLEEAWITLMDSMIPVLPCIMESFRVKRSSGCAGTVSDLLHSLAFH